MHVTHLWLFVGLLGLALPAAAAEKGLFADDFVIPDVEKVWRLQPPVDALGPIPANAAWAADSGALTGTGTAKPWSVMTAGDPGWTDYRVSAQITIRKPAPKADYTIFHGEYDRYLPREWFPKLCDHTGVHRFRYYAGEFDWGSDVALYFRFQDRENCYRVQFSTEYQEVILWHSVGGYLQVVPYTLQPGKAYDVDVQAQGEHIQVTVDGKKLIDYWHRCLPTLTGGIGLGIYNSGVAFQQVRVSTLPPAAPMPAHKASFSKRIWRTQPWIFDGHEPICLLETGNTGFSPDYGDGVMMFYFVKLRPGYRPLYQTFVSVRKNEAKTALLKGTENDVAFTGEGTDRLVFSYDGETSDTVLSTRHTDVLTYDAVRGTYQHHITANLTFNKDERIFALEFCDPLTYNSKEPGRQVKQRWLPAGHRWGLMRSEDRSITRHPISQSLDLDGQNCWYLQPGNGLWVLYPDRAVCPAWEHFIPNERTYVGVCHWGYDWHQYIHWGDKPRDMKAGAKMTITHTFTGYTPMEAERIYNASALHPKNDQPEKFRDKPMAVFKVPSMLGYAVCDPSGTSFDQLANAREPYVGWQFYGDYQMENEGGRTDKYSMRLDGPAKAAGMMYHHMLEPANRYQCTLWLKTKDVKGPLTVKLCYPWNPKLPQDVVETGLYGDNDWTELAFVSTIPCITAEQYDASEISVEVQGGGTVWVDDFSLLPVADGQPGVENRPAAKPAPAVTPSADYLMYLPCTEGSGVVVSDASHRGNGAKLYQVQWATENGRPVLRFTDKFSAAFVKMLSPELLPIKEGYPRDLTFDAWIKPSAGRSGDVMGFFNSPRLYLNPVNADQLTLNLSMLYGGKWESLTTPAFPAGAWTHVAGTIAGGKARLYVNGKMVQEKALVDGKLTFTHYNAAVSIGTYDWFGNTSFNGDMAELRWWARAASDQEIAATAAKGRP